MFLKFDHGARTMNISDTQVAIEFVVAAVAGVAALLLASALGK
jgi:photosystem I reaction center subunit XII